MKKTVIATVTMLLAILISGILYCSTFPIKADMSNLIEYVERALNSKTDYSAPNNDIKLYETINIGNKKIVLVEINEQLGKIHLIKGINGKYRVDSVGYGTSNFQEKIIEENQKKYFLIGGRNAVFGIRKITVYLEGQEYSMGIPEQEQFFVFTEVNPDIEMAHADLNEVKFYNRNGEDITEQIQWN